MEKDWSKRFDSQESQRGLKTALAIPLFILGTLLLYTSVMPSVYVPPNYVTVLRWPPIKNTVVVLLIYGVGAWLVRSDWKIRPTNQDKAGS